MKTTKMFKSALQSLNLFVMIFSFAACTDKQLEFSGTGSSISGSIAGFSALSSKPSQSISAFSCTTPQAEIYSLDSNGVRSSSALATTAVAANGTFTFKNITSLGIDTQSSKVKYLIAISGCSDPLSRPLTDKKNQEISWGSTIVEKVSLVEYTGKKTLSEAQKAEVISLITKLDQISGSSLDAIFTNILSNPTVSSGFQTIFQLPATELQYSQPTVNTVISPSNVNELATANFSISASHWHPSYTVAYIWKLDGSQVATTANYNYIPSKTSQGLHTIELFIGKSDGAGGIDLTKAYITKSFTLTVNDTYQPVAPALSLVTTSPTNNQNITLSMNTGAALSNCDSFSTLALTEDTLAAPILSSAYNISCTNAGTQNINYSLTPGDGVHTFRLWARDSGGNLSPTPSTATVTLDQTGPAVSLSDLAATIRGGSSQSLAFTKSDVTSSLSSVKIQYAADGTTFSDVLTITSLSSPQSWTSPSSDLTGAKLKILATDQAGNSSSAITAAFNIDSTAPTAPSIARLSGVFSNSTAVSISATCVSDYDKILFSENSSTPAISDSNWENCAATKNFSVATGDGVKTIYAFTKDSVGNISTSSNITMTLDQSSPTVSLTGLPSNPSQGGSLQTISWSAADTNIETTPVTLEYSTDNGTTWTSIASSLNNGVNSGCTLPGGSTGCYPWTLVSADSSQAKIRLTAQDKASNSGQTASSAFTIDSTAPTISSFVLSGGSATTALPSITLSFSASDALSGNSQMQFSESATVGTNWVSYSTTGSFTLSQTNGTKTVYAWAKDAVGNISSSAIDTINLDFGSPPDVSIISPTAGSSYSTGNNVHIEWSCSSTNGLDGSPARIRYTVDDGLTFSDITTWTPNNLTATTGSYDWPLPSGVLVFRILAECKSAAGVVSSAYSGPINTGGWTIFAGDPANMSENVSMSVALMSRASYGYQSMAADINGNVFFEKGRAIMKIDAQSGLVTRFVGDPNYTSGLCNIQVGQSPINSSYDKLSSNPFILGPSPDRTSFYFSVCGKTWSINTTTSALTQVNTTAFDIGAGFLSRSGRYYYYSSGKFFRVDLTQINATPEVIFGNSTSCAYPVAAVGTIANQTPLLGLTTGACPGENNIFTNVNETKIWVGNWDGYGNQSNSVRLDWSSGDGAYVIGSTNVGWNFGWDYGSCVPSFKSNKVHCSGRWANATHSSFDTATETWTQAGTGRTTFIRYAATPTGMVSLDSTNYFISHIENTDGTITRSQVGGSNIETYGNGSDLSKVAFSSVDDITYSVGSGNLFVRTAGGLRSLAIGAYPSAAISTPTWNGAGSSWNRLTVNRSGSHLAFPVDWCGVLGYGPFAVSGSTVTAQSAFYNILGCNTGTRLAHPIADNTAIAGNQFGWENRSGQNDRPLMHSNGKQYLTVKNGTNDVILYSSDRLNIRWIAGRVSAGGHDALDSGNNANTALLQNANWLTEVPTGLPNTGDLLILDGTRLRMITITTSSATPKIYDLLDLGSLTGYPTGATVTDFWYDFASEISNGTNNVIGSGQMYFVTSANNVYKVSPQTVSGDTVTAATLSQYTFTGATFTGMVRIALTPAGLLVTQPNKARILRITP